MKGRVAEEKAERLIGPISEFFLFTIIAQVMTLPIMAYHFGGISWIALIANPLICRSVTGDDPGRARHAGGMLVPGLGRLLAVVAAPFVTYTIKVVTLLARLPGGNFTLPKFNLIWLITLLWPALLPDADPESPTTTSPEKVLTPQLGMLLVSGLVVLTWCRVAGRTRMEAAPHTIG